jgi:tetratricopeptide (TPR) repeat protein
LEHAGRALQLKPNDPDALELRGTLRYWRWLLNLEPDQTKAKELFSSAEQDLRAAVASNATAAVAWTWLSHLLMGQAQTAEAKLAARRAYEADPYLSTVRTTIWRLFQASLDLEDVVEANHWCAEGQSRFPQSHRFVECQIWLFSLKGVDPDVKKTWELLSEYERLAPASSREFNRSYGEMLVAMALARAGLSDSAKHVAERARADASVDPTRDLAQLEAVVRLLVGERDEALRLLSTYVAANPHVREAMARDQTWWFRDLRSDPRWRSLLGLAPAS